MGRGDGLSRLDCPKRLLVATPYPPSTPYKVRPSNDGRWRGGGLGGSLGKRLPAGWPPASCWDGTLLSRGGGGAQHPPPSSAPSTLSPQPRSPSRRPPRTRHWLPTALTPLPLPSPSPVTQSAHLMKLDGMFISLKRSLLAGPQPVGGPDPPQPVVRMPSA